MFFVCFACCFKNSILIVFKKFYLYWACMSLSFFIIFIQYSVANVTQHLPAFNAPGCSRVHWASLPPSPPFVLFLLWELVLYSHPLWNQSFIPHKNKLIRFWLCALYQLTCHLSLSLLWQMKKFHDMYMWIVLYCEYVAHFLCPFNHWQTLRLNLCPVYLHFTWPSLLFLPQFCLSCLI